MSVPDGPAEALDVLRLREQGGNDAHASSIEVGLGPAPASTTAYDQMPVSGKTPLAGNVIETDGIVTG